MLFCMTQCDKPPSWYHFYRLEDNKSTEYLCEEIANLGKQIVKKHTKKYKSTIKQLKYDLKEEKSRSYQYSQMVKLLKKKNVQQSSLYVNKFFHYLLNNCCVYSLYNCNCCVLLECLL